MTTNYEDYQTVSLFGKRFYDLQDRHYPSITTVLGNTTNDTAWLGEWRARIGAEEADKRLKAAGERGTNVHLLLERFLKNEPLELESFSIEHQRMFKQLKPLTKRINSIYGQEVVLYSDTLEVAGRCDLVGEWGGRPSIIDFKTSTRSKLESEIGDYFLQATFYAQAHNEMKGTSIDHIVIMMAVEKGLPLVFTKPITDQYRMDVKARASLFYKQLLEENESH